MSAIRADRGRHAIARAAGVLLVLAAVPVAIVNTYLALVTAAAHLRQRAARSGLDERSQPENRIAVLIPAHDEESNIAATIDSIVHQRYPSDLFSVHVVADNCSDGTAEVARRHGADVHERADSTAPGKGPALGWLVARLQERGEPVDAMVILDADTRMGQDFLRVADAAIAERGSAWQAYYTVRDPDLSPSVAVRHAALVLRHYVRPLGRTALGASSGLFGNGMVFRAELLRDRHFTAHLTEDVEFQLDLLLDGELVGFMPRAVVEAEMPTTLAAARSQNERWERGRLELAGRYLPRLARRAVRRRVEHRVALVDAMLDQLVPPLSVLATGTSALVAGAVVVVARSSSRAARTSLVLAGVSTAAMTFHVIGGLRVVRVPRAVYVALLQAPRLMIWKVVLWVRVLLRPAGVSWTRTTRNSP